MIREYVRKTEAMLFARWSLLPADRNSHTLDCHKGKASIDNMDDQKG